VVNRIFAGNARHRPPRKNGGVLYHEVLSLARADRKRATPEVLADLAHHYLTLGAPGVLGYGVVHMDGNPHIHLMISGNLRGSRKKLRLGRAEFAQVKRDLEVYQKERYPFLSHSLVCSKGKTPAPAARETPADQARDRRQREEGRGERSRKARVREQVPSGTGFATPSRTFVWRRRAA